MKKIIFTLMLLWSFISVKAYNYQASALTLNLFDNAAFTLTFDNNTYNTPSNTYNVHNIMPGNHFIQVVKMANSYGPGHCAMPVVVYSGYVSVPAASQVYASVSGINQLTINSIQPLYTVNNGGCNNGYNGNTQYGPVPAYMSDADFSALKGSVNSKSFDSSKLTVAKQAVASDRLTARQVAELMDLFSFESTKLDLAKYSYRHVVDPQNYYVVNDSFTFSSSITELDQYIAKN